MKNRIRALKEFLEEIAGVEISYSNTPFPDFDSAREFPEDVRCFMQVIGRCEIGSEPSKDLTGYQILNVDCPIAMSEAYQAYCNGDSILFVWEEETGREIFGIPSDELFLVANDCDNQSVWLQKKTDLFTNSVYNKRLSKSGDIEVTSFFEWVKYYLVVTLEYNSINKDRLNKLKEI